LGTAINAGFGDGVPIYAGLALTSHYNGFLSLAKADSCTIGGEDKLTFIRSLHHYALDKTVALQWL